LGGNIFDFGRKTIFCLGHRPSTDEIIKYAKNFGGHGSQGSMATSMVTYCHTHACLDL